MAHKDDIVSTKKTLQEIDNDNLIIFENIVYKGDDNIKHECLISIRMIEGKLKVSAYYVDNNTKYDVSEDWGDETIVEIFENKVDWENSYSKI